MLTHHLSFSIGEKLSVCHAGSPLYTCLAPSLRSLICHGMWCWNPRVLGLGYLSACVARDMAVLSICE